jgi:uncharacterized membrane protein YeaQ/YmgE (transglycosylase-associated protein family)
MDLKNLFSDQNIMLGIVGGTVLVAVTQSIGATPAAIRNAPLLTLGAGAVLLPIANTFLGKKGAAAVPA